MTWSIQNAKTQLKDLTLPYSLRAMQQCHLQNLDKVLNPSGRDKRFYVKSRQQQQQNPNTTSQPLQFLVNSEKAICNSRMILPSGSYSGCQRAIYTTDTEGTEERMQRNNAQPAL